jgi:hypothetical protein
VVAALVVIVFSSLFSVVEAALIKMPVTVLVPSVDDVDVEVTKWR